MNNTRRARLMGALALAVATAGCGIGTGLPLRPSTSTAAAPGPSAFAPSPSPTPSVMPAVDLAEFDSRFMAAVDAAVGVPLAGLPPTETASPMCQAIGEPASPARVCIAAFPAANPVVTITANAARPWNASTTTGSTSWPADPICVGRTTQPRRRPLVAENVWSQDRPGDHGCLASESPFCPVWW